jgi:hypothetical protein
MGNCWTKGADKDSKRHPLLRNDYANSDASTSGTVGGVEAQARSRSVVTVRSMEVEN